MNQGNGDRYPVRVEPRNNNHWTTGGDERLLHQKLIGTAGISEIHQV